MGPGPASPLGLGPRWMKIRFMGNFTGHKSDFFNFSIGVPIHKKKPRDEITIITGTVKIPKRKDTICGSPSLFSFIATKSKDSKNDAFDAVCRGSLLLRDHKKEVVKLGSQEGRRRGGTTSPPLISTPQPRPQARRVSPQATIRPQDTPRPSPHIGTGKGSYGPPSSR